MGYVRVRRKMNLFHFSPANNGGDKDRLVISKADRSVILNKAVKVLDIKKAASPNRLFLATEKDF